MADNIQLLAFSLTTKKSVINYSTTVSPSITTIPITSSTSGTAIVADTSATGHYLMVDGPYVNAIPVTQGIDVLLPSGTQIRSSHTAQLIIPGLPLSATQCHVLPDLIAGSLLSIGLLCDHGCVAKFDATTVTIFHSNNIIITGFRCPLTKL